MRLANHKGILLQGISQVRRGIRGAYMHIPKKVLTSTSPSMVNSMFSSSSKSASENEQRWRRNKDGIPHGQKRKKWLGYNPPPRRGTRDFCSVSILSSNVGVGIDYGLN